MEKTMTMATYHSALFTTTSRPLTGLGTKHHCAAWTDGVRTIRAALRAARNHTPPDVLSGETLAEILIDLADSLCVQDRALLAVVLGDLERMSRRDRKSKQLDLPFTR
jgi:hypothetical protein